MDKLIVGDPLDKCIDVGAVVDPVQRAAITAMIDANTAGETHVAACTMPDAGCYYPPTLITGLAPSDTLMQEEIFGPVQVLIPFKDETEAVRIANSTDYGLVAGIWTRDGARQLRLAKALKSGQVFINNYGAGGGVELPFGGVGKSGHGREKGFEALYGFSTLKTVAAWHG